MQVPPLGPEDPLEEGMATHSSVAWRIPGTEEPGGLQSMGLQRVGHDWATNTHTTEAEDIKRWQEYIKELYKQDLHNPDNHDGMITHL